MFDDSILPLPPLPPILDHSSDPSTYLQVVVPWLTSVGLGILPLPAKTPRKNPRPEKAGQLYPGASRALL